jgi:hypothetical protein
VSWFKSLRGCGLLIVSVWREGFLFVAALVWRERWPPLLPTLGIQWAKGSDWVGAWSGHWSFEVKTWISVPFTAW